MSKRERILKEREIKDISGSETLTERIKKHTPWILGSYLRKPKIIFPKIRRRTITVPTPSKTLGITIIYIILFVLQTGIVYLIYREPPALGADAKGDPIFLYPSIHDSFIVEGIVASILIFVSSTGFIFLYSASKHSFNRTMALRILVLGLLMILVSFFALQYLIAVKTGNDPFK
ncbi:MAG: hypothetical protein ACFFD2_27465 [Promethearchaeota archaeon]